MGCGSVNVVDRESHIQQMQYRINNEFASFRESDSRDYESESTDQDEQMSLIMKIRQQLPQNYITMYQQLSKK